MEMPVPDRPDAMTDKKHATMTSLLQGATTRRPMLLLIAGLLVMVVLASVLGLLVCRGRRDEPSPRRQTRAAPPPDADDIAPPRPTTPAPPAVRGPGVARAPGVPRPRGVAPVPRRTPEGQLRYEGEITAGLAVITALRRCGISSAQGLGLLQSLKGLFDFRRARPGHRFVLVVDPDRRRPVYLRYRVSLSEVYEVNPAVKGPGFVGRRVPIRIERKTVGYAGTVTSSLGRALSAQGAGAGLVGQVADVLTAQPRFFKAQRAGDVFRVLVEEQRVEGKRLRYGPVLALEYQGAREGQLLLVRYQAPAGKAEYYNERGISRPTSRLHTPVHYTRISSPFGMRMHPVLKRRVLHSGVDLVAPSGTPVRACLDGTVLHAGRRGAYGNLVILDHGDGLRSYYAHLLRFSRGTRKGKKVKRRQVIAQVGNTGRSTGAHLHFSIWQAGRFVDPLVFRIRPGRPVPARHRAAWQRVRRQRLARLRALPVHPPGDVPAYVPRQDHDVTGEEEP